MELPALLCLRSEAGPLMADATAAFWRKLPVGTFREAASGVEPRQGTSIRAMWDAEELRVLFHAKDTHSWATLTERDGPLWEEEVVEVFLDPVGDLESYFEIEVNPLNTVLDLVLRRNRSGYVKDSAWHCEGLRTAVAQTATAWSAELAIPFRGLLGTPPEAGDRWRVNFCRIDRPPGVPRELTAWSPTGLANFHIPARFGILEFVA